MADGQVTRNIVQALPHVAATTKRKSTITHQTVSTDRTQNGGVSSYSAGEEAAPSSSGAVLSSELIVKRKRGRPPRTPASAAAAVAAVAAAAAASGGSKRSKNEEEDVCFICFDGGSLVMCDRRDCPKAYHPACVKRDESFFRPNIRWNCGWHLCNICQRNALFMCYTCPYSLCKGCVKQADILRIRGNKGFCRTCMSTIMLIEKVPQENKDLVQVDFDDTTSWEYLFKVYWVLLKEKERLSLDELIRATNPWRVAAENNNFQLKNHETCKINGTDLSRSYVDIEANDPKRRKTRKQLQQVHVDSQKVNKVEDTKVSDLMEGPDWATKELLEFVAHLKNGDTAALSPFDVQALLLDYIKQKNLRDPRRKCQIICDNKLQDLFKKERVGHFEMLKLLDTHFTDKSLTSGVIRGAAEPSLSGLEEGTSGGIQNPIRDIKRQSRIKGEDRDRQSKMKSYAAIDSHNINLIYLKRGLLESLMVDAASFHDKVVGSIVRIKISSSDQKQDMHRLVRIIGTNQGTEQNKSGDKVDKLKLEILNLNKIENITTDEISDQEFSEDECRRLRQSIKLGLVERMTVGEIQEKAMVLQAMRVSDWLETEIRKLSHLRDRASEMGLRKELREYVEKIDLLKTPEERQRRTLEFPEVHADPRMHPSYGSDDDSGDSDNKKQDVAWTPKYSKATAKSLDLISPKRLGDMSKNDRVKPVKTAVANGDRKRKHSAKSRVGRVEGTTTASDLSRETERSGSASKSIEVDDRTKSSTGPGDCRPLGVNGSISKCTSDPLTLVSQGMPPVPDVSEQEKIWHYRDPSGKVQGPFCMFLLRKWYSNDFFPCDLRVWKTNEAYDQSVLLADALKQQQSYSESCFQQPSCLQSHDGASFDDGKVNSVGGTGSNSSGSSMDKANEEGSNSNLTDIASTPEAHEQSVSGYSCQAESDSQGGAGQSLLRNFKAQLIDSLFNIEEPCSEATRSPDTMDADLKYESSHPSSAMTKSDHVEYDSQALKSDPSTTDAGRPDSETSVASKHIEPSNLPVTMPDSNKEEMKVVHIESKFQDSPNDCENFGASGGSGSGVNHVSDVPDQSLKTENKDIQHTAAVVDYELDAGAVSGVSGVNDVSVLPNGGQQVENESLKPPIGEKILSVSLNSPGGSLNTSWTNVSCGADLPLLANTKLNEVTNIENKFPATSNAHVHGSGASWSTISAGVMVSDIPISPQPESNDLKTPTTGNEVASDSNIPGRDTGMSLHNTCGGAGFSQMLSASLKLDDGAPNGIAAGNNLCLNIPEQDPCMSWSTSSSLVGGQIHLPDVTADWGWQPIELSTLGDDSVSDLLSEVEAMESLRGMSSPSSRMNCGDDSIGSPGDGCFSPLGGLSPHLDPGRNDALSSTADLQFQLHHNHMQPNHSDQPHETFLVSRTSCTLSTLGPEVEAVVKPVILSVPNHMQPNRSDQPNGSFHDVCDVAKTSYSFSALVSELEAEVEVKPAIPSVSNHMQPNHRDQLHESFNGVCNSSRISSILSTLGLEPEVEVEPKPAIASGQHHNFVSESPLPSVPPPPTTLPSVSPPPAPLPSVPSTLIPSPQPTFKAHSPLQSSSPPTAAAAEKSPPPPSPATKSPPLPSPAAPTEIPPPPPSPPFSAAKPLSPIPLPPPSAPASAKTTSLPPPTLRSAAAAKQPLPPQSRPSPLDLSSSPREEGEVEPTIIAVYHEQANPVDRQPPQTASLGHSWKQGAEAPGAVREPVGLPNGKFYGGGSILGTPNIHWGNSGQAGPAVSANTHWSASGVSQGTRVNQTSPRFNHNAGRHPGPKDRSHHHHAVDSGFGKNRPTSWNRQSSFGGGGGPSRPPHRGQRVCKFYESGYCKRGASCTKKRRCRSGYNDDMQFLRTQECTHGFRSSCRRRGFHLGHSEKNHSV